MIRSNNGNSSNTNQGDVSVVLELLEIAAKVERRLDRSLSVIRGLSFSEFRLLSALDAQYESRATRVDLADAVGLTPSAVTRALKPLEKLHYVKTEKSQRDARQSLATLTPSGRELLSDSRGIVADAVGNLPVQELSPAHLHAFAKGLT